LGLRLTAVVLVSFDLLSLEEKPMDPSRITSPLLNPNVCAFDARENAATAANVSTDFFISINF
jgi:hypothetical protein